MLTTINLDLHPILPNQAGPNGERILGKPVGLLMLAQGTIGVSSPGIEGMTGVKSRLSWQFARFGQVVDNGPSEQFANNYVMISQTGDTYLKDFHFMNQFKTGDMYELYDKSTSGILGVCLIAECQTSATFPHNAFMRKAPFNTLRGAFV